MIYYIDFDRTIRPVGYDVTGQYPPQKACVEKITKLKTGHLIIIYSCRSNPAVVSDWVRATKDMEDYLKKYNIPYDCIQTNKPYFDKIIDDRNVGIPLDATGAVDWEKLNIEE